MPIAWSTCNVPSSQNSSLKSVVNVEMGTFVKSTQIRVPNEQNTCRHRKSHSSSLDGSIPLARMPLARKSLARMTLARMPQARM